MPPTATFLLSPHLRLYHSFPPCTSTAARPCVKYQPLPRPQTTPQSPSICLISSSLSSTSSTSASPPSQSDGSGNSSSVSSELDLSSSRWAVPKNSEGGNKACLYILDTMSLIRHVQDSFHSSSSLYTTKASKKTKVIPPPHTLHAFTVNLLSLLKSNVDGQPLVCVFPLLSDTSVFYKQICEALGLRTVVHNQPYNVIASLARKSRFCGLESTIILSANVDNLQLLSVLNNSKPSVNALVFQKAGTFQLITLETLPQFFNTNELTPRRLIDAMTLAKTKLTSSVQMALKLVSAFDSLENIIDTAMKNESSGYGGLSPRIATRIIDFHNYNDLLLFKRIYVRPVDCINVNNISWKSLQRSQVNLDGIHQIIPFFNKSWNDILFDRMVKSADDVQNLSNRKSIYKSFPPILPLTSINSTILQDAAFNPNPSVTDIEKFMTTISSNRIIILPMFSSSSSNGVGNDGAQNHCANTTLSLKSLVICKDIGNSIVIPLHYSSSSSSSSSQQTLACLKQVLCNNTIEKQGWFLKELYKYMYVHYDVCITGRLFDMHIASRLLHAGNDFFIGNDRRIALHYLGRKNRISELFKRSSLSTMLTTDMLTSSFQDAQTNHAEMIYHSLLLADRLREHLQLYQLEYTMFQVEGPLIPILARMELHGAPVNCRSLNQLHDKLRQQRISLRAKLIKLMRQHEAQQKSEKHKGLSVSRPRDVMRMLYGNDSRFKTLSQDDLKKIINDGQARKKVGYSDIQKEFAIFYTQYKKISQVLQGSTLTLLKHMVVSPPTTATGDDKINEITTTTTPPNFRVHCDFIQIASNTGRISTRNPNLQCLSTSYGIRHLISSSSSSLFSSSSPSSSPSPYVNTARFKILTADYSQIELRIIASLSQDEHLCTLLSERIDIHRRMASLLFGITPETSVTASQRRTAKQVIYAILYGASLKTIAAQGGIQSHQAERLVEQFFTFFPDVSRFIDSTVRHASSTGFVVTPTGRRIMTHSATNVGKSPVVINMPIQATQADMIKLAMCRVCAHALVEAGHVRLVLQLHDELVFEVEEERVEEATLMIFDAMAKALPLEGVAIGVNIGVGDTWQGASEGAQLFL